MGVSEMSSEQMRAEFEALYSVPPMTQWSEKHGEYISALESVRDEARTYTSMFFAYCIGRQKAARAQSAEPDGYYWEGYEEGIKAAREQVPGPIRRILVAALEVAKDRDGDVPTEDGDRATTSVDDMIELESALADAFSQESDDVEPVNAAQAIETLAAAPQLSAEPPVAQSVGVPWGWWTALSECLTAWAYEANQGDGIMEEHGSLYRRCQAMCEAEEEKRKHHEAAPQPTTQPDWIACSERLPTEADSDCEFHVWVFMPIGFMGEVRNSVFLVPWGTVVNRTDHLTHWKPTGLSRPERPAEERWTRIF